MLTRRWVLSAGTGMLAMAGLPRSAFAADASGLRGAMDDSALIYLTPLRRDGSESRCQSEVWFVHYDADLYVVTAHDAWRARAIASGLTRARIWVGDVGRWSDSDGSYRRLPQIEALASQVQDAQAQDAVLDAMGDKYRLEWLVWGPRFRKGLADGSRVMLCYQPVKV